MKDCRGLLLNLSSGEVVARPLHKFFNCGQRPDSSIVDLGEECVMLEKLDGVMVFGFVVNEQVGFASKGGLTVQASAAWRLVAADGKRGHVEFVMQMDRLGYTPVFELCCAAHVVRIRYSKESVVLIACRHKESGRYMWYHEMVGLAELWGIPVVPVLGEVNQMLQAGRFKSLHQLSDWVYHSCGKEGGVLVFRGSGKMVKCKTLWWKGRQQEVDRRLQSHQVLMLKAQVAGREQRQCNTGKHKDVRALVVGDNREGLSFYQWLVDGVHHMEGLLRRQGGVRCKLFLVFRGMSHRNAACKQAYLEGSQQYFRLVPAISNRIHSSEQFEVKKWLD